MVGDGIDAVVQPVLRRGIVGNAWSSIWDNAVNILGNIFQHDQNRVNDVISG